jgi:hypothetical protein
MPLNNMSLFCFESHDSSVGIVLGCRLDSGVLGFNSWQGMGIFLFTTVSRMALDPVGKRMSGAIPPSPNKPS